MIRREGVDGADVPSEFRLQDSTFDIFFHPVYTFATLMASTGFAFVTLHDGLLSSRSPKRVV